MDQTSDKYNIICFSNQLWDYPLWTNKKHVMTRLSAQGHNVLFVDPPINAGRLFLRQLFQKKWTISRLLAGTYTDDLVKVYSPVVFLPLYTLFAHLFAKRINKLSEAVFDPHKKTLLWVYHVEMPDIEVYLDNVKYDKLIYDCVDNYAAFPKYDTPEKKAFISHQEEVLAKRANIVFATAPGLVDRLTKYNPRTFYTPNVGDYERFKDAKTYKNSLPRDLAGIPRPVIAFTGAVDEYKFDRKLFRKLAEAYPNYSFVIIGPMALKDRESSLAELGLNDLKNVYYLKTVPFKELPKYAAGFDVFIIPYQLNDYTVGGCFPVKFHEGLAAGLPVVVTNLPAYRPFEDVCYISKSDNEFLQNVRRALEEDSDQKIKERQKVAKENSWEGKVVKLLDLIRTQAS
jgi:glycosyltransferase involved in cell wall biosynthesis